MEAELAAEKWKGGGEVPAGLRELLETLFGTFAEFAGKGAGGGIEDNDEREEEEEEVVAEEFVVVNKISSVGRSSALSCLANLSITCGFTFEHSDIYLDQMTLIININIYIYIFNGKMHFLPKGTLEHI